MASTPIIWDATGTAALQQAVAWMCLTPVGTVPLLRTLGADHGIGESVAAVKGRLSGRLVTAFARHLPEVRVVRVSWAAGIAGALIPSVTWRPA